MSFVGRGLGTGFGTAGLSKLFPQLGEMIFGKQERMKQPSTLTPEGQEFLKNLFGQLGGGGQVGQNYGMSQNYLQSLLQGSPEAYEKFAAPYKTQFQEQTLPGIAERFAGMGGGLGGGALSSSGFGQALGGAGAQFQSNLANLYAHLQQQAAQQAMSQYGGLSNLGLGTRAFENILRPGDTGILGSFLSGISGAAGKGIGTAAGNRAAAFFGG